MKDIMVWEFISKHIKQFPHCDFRVLHAPGACMYCDMLPEWQALRLALGIAFTGENHPKKIKCPSEQDRDLEAINKWPGNQPKP